MNDETRKSDWRQDPHLVKHHCLCIRRDMKAMASPVNWRYEHDHGLLDESVCPLHGPDQERDVIM